MSIPNSLRVQNRPEYTDEQKLIVKGVNGDIEVEEFWREMDRIHGMSIEEEPTPRTQ